MIRLVALLVLLAGSARAEGVLRVAGVVPDGTGWARELRAFARDVEARLPGVRVKWYMGGIAGDELEVLDRIRRGQLDGIVSAGMACERLAPTLRVMRIPGLVQSWAEAAYLVGRLRPTLDRELEQAGFVNLGEAGVGPEILFTRHPARSLQELRKLRFWVWDIDESMTKTLPAMGLSVLALPIRDAARAYELGRHDGYLAPATAALGFQWSAQTRYYMDLRPGFVMGCMLVANRFFDAQPLEARDAIRAAAAKLQARFEDIGRTQDELLLGGLFKRQGLTEIPVSPAFRAAFFDAARAARRAAIGAVVPQALVDRALSILADYRAEHAR